MHGKSSASLHESKNKVIQSKSPPVKPQSAKVFNLYEQGNIPPLQSLPKDFLLSPPESNKSVRENGEMHLVFTPVSKESQGMSHSFSQESSVGVFQKIDGPPKLNLSLLTGCSLTSYFLPSTSPSSSSRCNSRPSISLSNTFKTSKSAIKSLAFSPSSNVLMSVEHDGFLRVYSLASSQPSPSSYYQTLSFPVSSSHATCLSTDFFNTHVAVGTLSNNIQIFDINSSEVVHSWAAHDDSVSAFARVVSMGMGGDSLTDENMLISSSWDSSVKCWDLRCISSSLGSSSSSVSINNTVCDYNVHSSPLRAICVDSSTSSLIASSDDIGVVCIYSLVMMKMVFKHQFHHNSITSLYLTKLNEKDCIEIIDRSGEEKNDHESVEKVKERLRLLLTSKQVSDSHLLITASLDGTVRTSLIHLSGSDKSPSSNTVEELSVCNLFSPVHCMSYGNGYISFCGLLNGDVVVVDVVRGIVLGSISNFRNQDEDISSNDYFTSSSLSSKVNCITHGICNDPFIIKNARTWCEWEKTQDVEEEDEKSVDGSLNLRIACGFEDSSVKLYEKM
jgi:WD40 repeat protein